MKHCLFPVLALLLTPCAAYAQDTTTDPTTEQPTAAETAKQLGGQLLLSLFGQLVNGKKKVAPAAEPVVEDAVAAEPQPEAAPAEQPVLQPQTTSLRTVKMKIAK